MEIEVVQVFILFCCVLVLYLLDYCGVHVGVLLVMFGTLFHLHTA